MGAVRIRETYLRGDGLLVSMADTLLGEGGRGGATGSGPLPPTETAVRDNWKDKGGDGDSGDGGDSGRTCYVCPTADFLQCYLELFGRPSVAACFQRGGDGGGGGVGGEKGRPAGCSLLLLHSELSKLTGAAGALSMKQERHLAQVSFSVRSSGCCCCCLESCRSQRDVPESSKSSHSHPSPLTDFQSSNTPKQEECQCGEM